MPATTENLTCQRLQGRVCVITGVLGTIGEAVASRFRAEGATVVGVDRRAHAVGDISLRADMLDEGAVEDLYAGVVRTLGRLDVVYNNIGPTDPDDHSAIDTTLETWNRVMSGVLTTTWLSCKHSVHRMLASGTVNGSIINTASFLAGMGSASAQMAFNAAKAGVEQLSRDLGVQLARSGIRVNALALGPVQTPEIAATFSRLGSEQTARRLAHMPMGRFATPQEVASAAAFLASDDAGFITASIFPLDGAIRAAFTVPEPVASGMASHPRQAGSRPEAP